MTKLQYKISEFDGSRFPSGHDVMRDRILRSGYLDDATKAKLLKLLERLPQGKGVCHSDLHPGNIIVLRSKELPGNRRKSLTVGWQLWQRRNWRKKIR